MISGDVKVECNVIHTMLFKEVVRMAPEEVLKLKDGFLWFDWFSIPQITVRKEGATVGKFRFQPLARSDPLGLQSQSRRGESCYSSVISGLHSESN